MLLSEKSKLQNYLVTILIKCVLYIFVIIHLQNKRMKRYSSKVTGCL